MIIEVRVPDDTIVAGVRIGQKYPVYGEIVTLTPEFKLTEKEQILSKLFGLGITQEFKEVLAKVVNKVYEK
jgi:hypothetical protein